MKAIQRERIGLFGLWAALIATFGWWPSLDLWISHWFYVPALGFPGRDSWLPRLINELVPWAGRLLLAWTLASWAWHRWARGPAAPRQVRQGAVLALALTIGLGGVVHEVLKNNWGRARPDMVQAFGGTATFTSPLQPTDQCTQNCSFVSGHAATGFALMAVGMLGRPAYRRRWLAMGAAAGLGVGFIRILSGRHFLSDILFCMAVMWTCSMVIRWAWLAWRRHRHVRARRPADSPAPPPTYPSICP